MITVNYHLFIQVIFTLWVIGGVGYLIASAFETDSTKQTVGIISGVLMLAVVGACLVL